MNLQFSFGLSVDIFSLITELVVNVLVEPTWLSFRLITYKLKMRLVRSLIFVRNIKDFLWADIVYKLTAFCKFIAIG